jgi:hypothetical protein
VAQPPVLSKLPTINPSASNAAEGGNQNVMHPTAGPSVHIALCAPHAAICCTRTTHN